MNYIFFIRNTYLKISIHILYKMVVIGICGITGAQGGAVADACLKQDYSVKGLTRNTSSDKAVQYKQKGVELVQADYDNTNSLKGVFDGCDAVFIMTNFWEHMDAKREYKQAKAIIDSAIESKVPHLVWSSLEDTRDYKDNIVYIGEYKVPHLDEKGMISKYLKTLDVNATHLYTSFYYENFTGMMKLTKDEDGIRRLCLPMSQSILPIVTVEDIGKMVHKVVKDKIYGNVGVASDHLTGSDMAKTFSEALGEPVEYVPVPASVYRGFGFPGCEDIGNMFEFKDVHNKEFCQSRNMEDVKKLISPVSFKEWCVLNKALL